MKKSEMIYIKESRQNLIGFLHYSQINELKRLLDVFVPAQDFKSSYHQLCDKVISLYEEKLITNKSASAAFEILRESNSSFRTESHRFESGKIFEYSAADQCYVFSHMGSEKEFKQINHYID